MEKLRTDLECEHWNVHREQLNLVIDAYNQFIEKKISKAAIVKIIHTFEEYINGIEESGAYLKIVDDICISIKYDRIERKNVRVAAPSQFELATIDTRSRFSY